MNTQLLRKKTNYLKGLVGIVILILSGYSTLASAEGADWKYGIGTGMSALNYSGDISLETQLAGPQTFDVDLDPGDFNDLIETAFGFNAFATNGTWMMKAALGNLELEGDSRVGTTDVDFDFTKTTAEFSVVYQFFKTRDVNVGVLGGVLYTKHELNSTTTVGASTIDNDNDNDWTDAALGLTVDVPINKQWTWVNMARAEFGESEGGGTVSTGLNWAFAKNWAANATIKYQAVDFENGSSGDSDWYKYEMDETAAGIGFHYIF